MIRLFIMLLTISYAHADILEREDVQNFIKLENLNFLMKMLIV